MPRKEDEASPPLSSETGFLSRAMPAAA